MSEQPQDTLEEDIRKFALGRGAVAVGYASVEDIERHAPPGHRPSDYVTGARSVVVMGRAPSPSAWSSPHPNAMEWSGFGSAAAGLGGPVARYIEGKHGYYALAAPTVLVGGHIPNLSFKLMAEMAGLGTRSLAAQIIMNEKYGLLYFGAVITSLPLTPTGPLEKALCPSPVCTAMWDRERTTPCLTACPECIEGELEDGKIKWARFNQMRCYSRAQTYGPDAFQKLLLEIVNEPDPERRKFLAFSPQFSLTVRNISLGTITARCFECTRVCPLGYQYKYPNLK